MIGRSRVHWRAVRIASHGKEEEARADAPQGAGASAAAAGQSHEIASRSVGGTSARPRRPG